MLAVGGLMSFGHCVRHSQGKLDVIQARMGWGYSGRVAEAMAP